MVVGGGGGDADHLADAQVFDQANGTLGSFHKVAGAVDDEAQDLLVFEGG